VLRLAAEFLDQAFEPATPGDREEASAIDGLNLVGVGDALRRQQGISGLETEILRPDAETEIPFQNMEDFILVLVQMERRGIAIRGEVLENGYLIRTVRVADPDYDGGVQEPEVVRTVTGAFG
jgi:hypothetical protein